MIPSIGHSPNGRVVRHEGSRKRVWLERGSVRGLKSFKEVEQFSVLKIFFF